MKKIPLSGKLGEKKFMLVEGNLLKTPSFPIIEIIFEKSICRNARKCAAKRWHREWNSC
jgi:hypothetical protein